MATLMALVLDIIMNEREVVNKLQSSRCRQSLVPVSSHHLARQQTQGGTQMLALRGFMRRALGIHPSHVIAHDGVEM
jgi:hypothetical protein